MWMLGAVLGVMALAVVVGGVWTWHASGRRTREDRADVVLRPRMERVSGGDAADRALLFAQPEGRGCPAPSLASDKNQEMDRLLNQRAIPADYAATMRTLHDSADQDDLTRNFAVQHLGLHVQEQVRRGTYDPHAPEAARVRATLDASANAPTRVIAVQLCGTRRVPAARAALRSILADPSSGTVLRLSAQRALALLE